MEIPWYGTTAWQTVVQIGRVVRKPRRGRYVDAIMVDQKE
jgi:hypothetical protein